MGLPPSVPKVARKTVTHIYRGYVYKERFILPDSPPAGSGARMVFVDSSGSLINYVSTTAVGKKLDFISTTNLSNVPDGAGFYCYLQLINEPVGKEHLIAYGTTFVR